MSEVKRYEFVYENDFGNEYPAFPRLEVDGDYVEFADFDRVTAERDALQQRLNATDERNDEAIDLLRRARAVIEGGGWADLERDIAIFFKPAEGKSPLIPPESERLMEIVQQYPNVDPLEYDAAVRTLCK